MANSSDLVVLDGSQGEGGGQILRTALSLSCVTGRPFRIYNIRANRAKPGLRAQHLACVRAAAAVCAARVEGAEIAATRLSFEPGEVRPGEYRFDIGTAGSASLVFQTVAYPLSFASGESLVTITGGTHNPMSPCFHYLEQCWAPVINHMGFRIKLELRRAGFYPKGGGEMQARILPAREVQPIHWPQRGALLRCEALAGAARLKPHVREREARQASRRLERMAIRARVRDVDLPAASPGAFVLIRVDFASGRAGFAALGAPGKPAERVADEACDALRNFLSSAGAVDAHLADQLLLPCVFAAGESQFATPTITSHLLTNAAVICSFTDAVVDVEPAEDAGRVRIHPWRSAPRGVVS